MMDEKEYKIQRALGTLPEWTVTARVKFEEHRFVKSWAHSYETRFISVRAINERDARKAAVKELKSGGGSGRVRTYQVLEDDWL